LGDLPVQFPNKSDLVANLKIAKAIGLTIPESILLRKRLSSPLMSHERRFAMSATDVRSTAHSVKIAKRGELMLRATKRHRCCSPKLDHALELGRVMVRGMKAGVRAGPRVQQGQPRRAGRTQAARMNAASASTRSITPASGSISCNRLPSRSRAGGQGSGRRRRGRCRNADCKCMSVFP
jgi:hypothetical protein